MQWRKNSDFNVGTERKEGAAVVNIWLEMAGN